MNAQRRPHLWDSHSSDNARFSHTAPSLEIIPGGLEESSKPRVKPTLRFAVTILVGVAAVLGIQLAMSVLLAQGAYEINSLQQELKEADRTVQSISEDIALLTSPQFLASQAAELGMVPTKNVSFLRLSDGKVQGSLKQASTGAISQPTVKNDQLLKEHASLSALLGISGAQALGEDNTKASEDPQTTPAANGLSSLLTNTETNPETRSETNQNQGTSSIASKPENRGLAPVE